MTLPLIILFLLLGAAVVAFGVVAERNRITYLDPNTLVIPVQDDPLPERILPFEGTVNFRDIGGYPAADGKRVRTGLIYRSAALNRLTENDFALMDKIGLKLVCDLRSQQEVDVEPDNLPKDPAPEYLHLPLDTDNENEQRERFMALVFNRRKLAVLMTTFYVKGMLENNPTVYGTIIKRIANADNLPAVIHCTAGKDRTGVGAALILSLLGVSEDIIVADYSLSNRYYDNYFRYGQRMVQGLRWVGVRPEHLQPLLIANPDNIRAALHHIRDTYGSAENYLRQKAAVTDDEIAALRANLLE